MPPAPAAEPKATAFIKLISKRKNVHDKMSFIDDGKTAFTKITKVGVPDAVSAVLTVLALMSKLMLKAYTKYAML